MDYNKSSKEILKLVGGEENVQNMIHCMTRLRFNLYDNSKVERSKLEKVPGVIGINVSGEQFQVIIGNDVSKVYKAILDNSKLDGNNKTHISGKKKNVLNSIFDVISGVFTPILPAIAGAGMIKGLLGVALILGWITDKNQTYIILNSIGDGAFYFLPILIAYSAARKFGSNPYVAAAIGLAIMHPNLTQLLSSSKEITFIGLPVTAATYAYSVIPILLAVWISSYVEKWVDRLIPSMLKLVLVPTITMLIVVPVSLITVGPLGAIIGNWLSLGVSAFFAYGGVFAGLILGGTWSLIVMTGMQYAFNPIMINNIAHNGYDYLFPSMFMANMGQAGAAFAVFLRSKNKSFKSLALSTSMTAIMGITEPAMYGVNMRLKKPFIGALVGGAVGGAYYSLLGVKLLVISGNFGFPGIASFIGPKFLYAVIGFPLAFAAGTIAAFILGFEDIKGEEESNLSIPKQKVDSDITSDGITAVEELYSPLKGMVKDLSEVNDAVFSTGLMGKGAAIQPEKGEVVSPVAGNITTVFKTKHAIGITSDNGAEILIHIGLNTVQLQGKYFTTHVKDGDLVNVGDPLVTFDMDAIESEGYDLITPVIITNQDYYQSVSIVQEEKVNIKEKFMTLHA